MGHEVRGRVGPGFRPEMEHRPQRQETHHWDPKALLIAEHIGENIDEDNAVIKESPHWRAGARAYQMLRVELLCTGISYREYGPHGRVVPDVECANLHRLATYCASVGTETGDDF